MEATQNSLHHSTGPVAEETALFKEMLEKNIGFKRPDASKAAVCREMRMASLEELVRKSMHSLQTKNGHDEQSLSGVKRQQIGIKRVVPENSAVMPLNRAALAVSSLNERKILENMQHCLQKVRNDCRSASFVNSNES